MYCIIATNSFDKIDDESNGVSRRLGHTANYDEKSALVYVFGGSKNKKWYSDIHTLDTKTMKWMTLQVNHLVSGNVGHCFDRKLARCKIVFI